ncbi:alpha/beta hydrolase [Actinomadura sp. NBRC 104412]|uniref:alpha/beta fold hydrolase n=1 Tax=Actinomadura sp. NBRC 104412 TaxID=3032203 RepID=UPI0024A33319|nr:alpha/beta fold hydrolase [Actinomadura sp. NBRC 104412]GLZ02596.1 alpha/beta hydrolase [Actinomadura sp. NBRC 104412]
MSFTHRILEVGGFRTHYLDAGDGPPLVLLHGGEYGAAAELTWEHCIDDLAAHFRVIAPDFYGYGASDKVRDFRGQRRRLMTQVRVLLESLGIGSARFVGTSLSGRLLLTAAASAPMAWPVEAMAVVGIGMDPPGGPGHDLLTRYDGSLDGLRPIMSVLFADPAFRDDEAYLRRRHEFCVLPGAWEFGAAAGLRLPRPGGDEATPHRTGRRAPSYDRVRVPSLFLLGSEDRLVPRESWERLVCTVPGARSRVIEGAGHYPQIERAKEFTDVLLDFLLDDEGDRIDA